MANVTKKILATFNPIHKVKITQKETVTSAAKVNYS